MLSELTAQKIRDYFETRILGPMDVQDAILTRVYLDIVREEARAEVLSTIRAKGPGDITWLAQYQQGEPIMLADAESDDEMRRRLTGAEAKS